MQSWDCGPETAASGISGASYWTVGEVEVEVGV